jgi:hypothetical protein
MKYTVKPISLATSTNVFLIGLDNVSETFRVLHAAFTTASVAHRTVELIDQIHEVFERLLRFHDFTSDRTMRIGGTQEWGRPKVMVVPVPQSTAAIPVF